MVLLLLTLLSGCSKEGPLMLMAPDEAGVWIVTKSGALEIEVSPEDAGMLTAISGKSLEESLDELFAPSECASISREAWDEREALLSLVMKETGCADTLEVLTKYGKELDGTEFMEIMDGLSGSFDDGALSKMLSRKGEARKYSLGVVLSKNSSWPETVDFVREWTRQISLKENIKEDN